MIATVILESQPMVGVIEIRPREKSTPAIDKGYLSLRSRQTG